MSVERYFSVESGISFSSYNRLRSCGCPLVQSFRGLSLPPACAKWTGASVTITVSDAGKRWHDTMTPPAGRPASGFDDRSVLAPEVLAAFGPGEIHGDLQHLQLYRTLYPGQRQDLADVERVRPGGAGHRHVHRALQSVARTRARPRHGHGC